VIRDNVSDAGCVMDKDLVKAKLLELEPALKVAGIVHLHLHSTVVRGEATPESDVDVAAQFDKTKRLSLIDLVGLQNMMSDVLGVEADLCDADRLKEHVQSNFDHEAELVF
jgi:predicted nucleotidyltransferase